MLAYLRRLSALTFSAHSGHRTRFGAASALAQATQMPCCFNHAYLLALYSR